MANCLSGPGWSKEQWNVAAHKAGMRINPVRRCTNALPISTTAAEVDVDSEDTVITVVGDQCFGDANETLREQALRLANIAETDLLMVQFSGREPNTFVGASAFPDIEDEMTANAVLSYLERP
jgi:hypothetical protein